MTSGCLNGSNASNDEYIKEQSRGLTFSVDDPLAASSGFGQVLLSWLHVKDPEHGQTATFIQDSQPQPTGLSLTPTLTPTIRQGSSALAAEAESSLKHNIPRQHKVDSHKPQHQEVNLHFGQERSHPSFSIFDYDVEAFASHICCVFMSGSKHGTTQSTTSFLSNLVCLVFISLIT